MKLWALLGQVGELEIYSVAPILLRKQISPRTTQLLILCGTNNVAKNEADKVIKNISTVKKKLEQKSNVYLVIVPNR